MSLVVLFSTSSGKWEVWGWLAICLLYLLTQPNTQCCKKKKKKKRQTKYTAANAMTYLTVYNQEVSLCLPAAAKRNPTDHHWGGNLKLNMRGLLILLLQVHSRLTPKCKDELKNWGREGEWLCVNPPSSFCCWLFHTLHSLPLLLLPPSFYNSTPLNYKPTASRNVCSLPRLLSNCPSTPLWEACLK